MSESIKLSGPYVLEKAGAYFTEVRLVFVAVLFQVPEELPLELVDVFNVAEDDLQLELCEHVRVLVALTDVALEVGKNKIATAYVLTNRRCCRVVHTKQRK